MPMNKNINLRIDEDLHENATNVLASMGLTLSDATHIFLSFVAKKKALPMEVFTADVYDEWFKEKVREAFEDTRPTIPHDEALARIKKRFEPRK